MALWTGAASPGSFRGLVKAAGFGECDGAVVSELVGTLEFAVTDLSAAAGRLVLSAELPCS